MKGDEEKDDTTRLGVNDEVSPERALPVASLMVEDEEPSESADMEVESAIAAIAAAGRLVCLQMQRQFEWIESA